MKNRLRLVLEIVLVFSALLRTIDCIVGNEDGNLRDGNQPTYLVGEQSGGRVGNVEINSNAGSSAAVNSASIANFVGTRLQQPNVLTAGRPLTQRIVIKSPQQQQQQQQLQQPVMGVQRIVIHKPNTVPAPQQTQQRIVIKRIPNTKKPEGQFLRLSAGSQPQSQTQPARKFIVQRTQTIRRVAVPQRRVACTYDRRRCYYV